MKSSPVRLRFWIELAVAALGVALLLLTLAYPEWIEMVFKVQPDQGSGSLELGISVALVVIAATSALLARAEWSRPLPSD